MAIIISNIRNLVRLSFCIVLVLSCCSKLAHGGIMFDPSDVRDLLADSSYVRDQISCVLGKSRCDNLGNQLKLAIPEVLGKNCRSCNAEQAANAFKVTEFIKDRFPAEFDLILKRYRIKPKL